MPRLIDADALIKNLEGIISDYTSNGFYPEKFGIDDFIDLIKEIPTISAPQWISVEDGPPDKLEPVLITDGMEVEEGYLNHWSVWLTMNGMRWDKFLKPITHWMPKPEPPKEESNVHNN